MGDGVQTKDRGRAVAFKVVVSFSGVIFYDVQLTASYVVMDDFKISKLDRFRFDFLKKI